MSTGAGAVAAAATYVMNKREKGRKEERGEIR